jgi:hypothetical protein
MKRRDQTMKKHFLILTIAVFFAACGGTANNSESGSESLSQKSEIAFNVGGQEKKFEPNSTWAYHSTKTFSSIVDGKSEMSTASITTIVLGNFELDTTQAFISLSKQKLDKPEQIKVMIGFTGEKDSKVDTPIKKGEYKAEGDKFSKIESLKIFYFADGKEQIVDLDDKMMKGTLNIKSVSGTTITGDIDVTDGKTSLKGTFSANGHTSVK